MKDNFRNKFNHHKNKIKAQEEEETYRTNTEAIPDRLLQIVGDTTSMSHLNDQKQEVMLCNNDLLAHNTSTTQNNSTMISQYKNLRNKLAGIQNLKKNKKQNYSNDDFSKSGDGNFTLNELNSGSGGPSTD